MIVNSLSMVGDWSIEICYILDFKTNIWVIVQLNWLTKLLLEFQTTQYLPNQFFKWRAYQKNLVQLQQDGFYRLMWVTFR